MPSITLALRSLARTPFVVAIAVLSLALGVGANAGVFSAFDQILLRPLPVHDPGRLVNLSAPGPKPGSQNCNLSGNCAAVFSYPMFRTSNEFRASSLALPPTGAWGQPLVPPPNPERRQQPGLGAYFSVLGLSLRSAACWGLRTTARSANPPWRF